MTETDSPLDHSVATRPIEAVQSGVEPPRSPSQGRLLGVDLARALAIFGMFIVHVGPSPDEVGGVLGAFLKLFEGRSAAIFATLAGVSLVLMSRRGLAQGGGEARRVRTRIAIRAVILIAAGTGLTMLGTTISVIIPYYGVFFLLAMPVLRVSARTLAIMAAVVALVGPALTLSPMIMPGVWLDTIAAYDPINSMDGRGIIDLLLVGAYPAVSWMAYVFAGMALAKIDLGSALVRKRLNMLGVVLGVIGYGGSWLAVHVFTDVQAQVDAATAADAAKGSTYDVVDQGTVAARLLVASPHSGTSFEIIGNIGVTLIVVAAAVAALAALPRLRRIASPVIAVGAMSLTAYIAHLLAIRYIDLENVIGPPLVVFTVFVVVTTVFAAVWSRFFRRGPLEYVLNLISTTLARLVR
jgi:uncharacterized membrane protein YeiB